MSHRKWTPEENEILRERWERYSDKELANILPRRTASAVNNQRFKLGLTGGHRKRWRVIDDEYLRNYWQSKTDVELAAVLGCTRKAIVARRQILGLNREGHRRHWTPEELQYIVEHWRGMTDEELTSALPGRSKQAVKQARWRLDLIRQGVGHWSEIYDECQKCGTSEVPHGAHGLCKQCYDEKRREESWECIREYGQRYRRKHQEERRLYSLQWHQRNRGWSRRYYQEHKGEYAERQRRWISEHREAAREQVRQRRARKAGAVIENVNEGDIIESYGNQCFYCGQSFSGLDVISTLDHIVPLFNEGLHCESNLIPACKSCNSSKSNKPLLEWIRASPTLRVWLF